jgi:hypothetical protein
MKKQVLMTAVLSLMTAPVFAAQTQAFDREVDAELDQMYSARQAPQTGNQASATMPQQGPQSGQPIYIMNQATPVSNAQASAQTQYQVQKQPVTYVEATPLNKSRADQIREARQQVEAETESKIVEKLEVSRMEDEKRRAGVLFGEQFNQLGQAPQQPQQQQQQQAVVVAPAPVAIAPVGVLAAPAPVQTAVADPEANRDLVREEVRTALDEEKKQKPETPTTQKYFSALAGMGDYPDVKNVRGNYLLGATFGTKFEDTYAVEGSFIYSNYTVQKLDSAGYYAVDQYGNTIVVPPLVDVQQYGVSMAVKYYLMNGMVRPIVGGVAQYSYRTFSWSAENYGGKSNAGGSDASSQAIDLGVITGADFEFSPKFSLGADFRYMFNMNSRVSTNNNSYFLTTPSYGTPIEKLQYYNLSLVARVTF